MVGHMGQLQDRLKVWRGRRHEDLVGVAEEAVRDLPGIATLAPGDCVTQCARVRGVNFPLNVVVQLECGHGDGAERQLLGVASGQSVGRHRIEAARAVLNPEIKAK